MKPFKILPTPANNPNGATQTQLIPSAIPKKGDPAVNEELTNEVPDHSPRIPWPVAQPLEQSMPPMRLKK